MKKIFVVISALFCLLLFPGLSAKAEDYLHGDYRYKVKNGTVTITAYFGHASELTVPSSINGKTVTALGNQVFNWDNCIGKRKKNAYTRILLKRGATNKMIFKTN